ncbi:hypothetical protein I6N90_06740 [Paenibacillus sp. GSMTC-2017]|uniref:hypothetical protein n=1 Tax=Paenibacillus sp. GSMTC-2017 TaxID=2794350 RepID=UPI0018D7A868|nr:hypothetical protein [Paenibacillus sp. GSMTC-2017]MBH5317512.1 hypothetical protein [Paenibacillus sp. GSMTC-2017]
MKRNFISIINRVRMCLREAKGMGNLIADMEQHKAKYDIDPAHFRIDTYLSHGGKIVIIARKDNNYAEWLSIGKLCADDYRIGQCIAYLLRHSPLPTSTSLYWGNYEQITKTKYKELFVFYQHLRITIEDETYFVLDGERITRDSSDEYIQQRLIQHYDDKKSTEIVDEEVSEIREHLQNTINEIRTMELECPLPSALNHVADYARKRCNELKAKYVFNQDEIVKGLLFELYEINSSIYNKYMTAVR